MSTIWVSRYCARIEREDEIQRMLMEAYEEHRRSRGKLLEILVTGITLDELLQERPTDGSVDRYILQKFHAADTFEKWARMIENSKKD